MWGWFSLWPGPRSIQKSTTSPASQPLVQGPGIAPLSPVLSASTQASINLRQVGFSVSSAKNVNPLWEVQHRWSSSALEDASSVWEKDWISYLQGFGCQCLQRATSVAGWCGRGLPLVAPGGRLLQHNCIPPFQCILTEHSGPGDKQHKARKKQLLLFFCSHWKDWKQGNSYPGDKICLPAPIKLISSMSNLYKNRSGKKHTLVDFRGAGRQKFPNSKIPVMLS